MTDKKDCMTMEQAEQKMECLREVFSIVRLVDGEMLEKRAEHSPDADAMEMCQCYSFWNKAKPCENCISMKSLREKKQAAKLEFLDSDIFQVFSRYVEIDGKPYVMEMLKKLDEDTLIDAVGYGKMVQKLSVYNDKLYRDALTGAYNRRYYEDEIKHVKGKAGVAILDVDDFKLYNDMHGHHAGDMALITVVEVIRQYIRKTDKLIRYGGDEFLLILPEIDNENFVQKLNKIKKKIAETSVPGYNRIKLSVSIGGVSATEETVEEAVQRADKQMYLAKMYKDTAMVEEMDQKIAEEDHVEHTDILRPLILIVDDSKINRELLVEILQDKYQIIEAENGNECVEKLEKYGNDIALILLDIVMPKMDGWEVCREIRKNSKVPIIMLTARSDERDELLGFDLGVDEYISKPFSPKILVARVEAILRRTGQNNPEDVISAGGIVIDKAAHLATVDGKPMELSFKEFELLTYFLENQGIALSREKILNSVWNYDYFGDARTIDTHVKKLRSKMGDKGEYIKTVWGMGYKFEVDE